MSSEPFIHLSVWIPHDGVAVKDLLTFQLNPYDPIEDMREELFKKWKEAIKLYAPLYNPETGKDLVMALDEDETEHFDAKSSLFEVGFRKDYITISLSWIGAYEGEWDACVNAVKAHITPLTIEMKFPPNHYWSEPFSHSSWDVKLTKEAFFQLLST